MPVVRLSRWLLSAAIASATGCTAWPTPGPPIPSAVWRGQTEARPKSLDARNTPEADALLLQARLAREEGRLTDARRLARAAQQAAPHFPQSYELEAQIALDQSDIAGYLDALQRLVDSQRADAAIQNAAGRLLTESGQAGKGLTALRRATRLAPEKADYWQDLAAALVARGDIAGAKAALRQGLAHADSAVQLWLAYARLCEAHGDHAAAADAYARAAQLDVRGRGEYLERANLCRYRAGLIAAGHTIPAITPRTAASTTAVQPADALDGEPAQPRAAARKQLIGAAPKPDAPPRVLRFDLSETTVAPVPAPPADTITPIVAAEPHDHGNTASGDRGACRDEQSARPTGVRETKRNGASVPVEPPARLTRFPVPAEPLQRHDPPDAAAPAAIAADTSSAASEPHTPRRTDTTQRSASPRPTGSTQRSAAAGQPDAAEWTGREQDAASFRDTSAAAPEASPAAASESLGSHEITTAPVRGADDHTSAIGGADDTPAAESPAGSRLTPEETAIERQREERIAALIDQADQAMQAGRYGLALVKLDELERLRDWRLPDLALLRAACALRSGNVWKARQILAAAAARWPDDPRVAELKNWIAVHEEGTR